MIIQIFKIQKKDLMIPLKTLINNFKKLSKKKNYKEKKQKNRILIKIYIQTYFKDKKPPKIIKL